MSVTDLTRRQWLAALLAARVDWPGFRGDGRSVTDVRNLPLEWSPESGIAWWVRLPGPGASAPVIWKDAVYVVSEGSRPEVGAYDLERGRVLWTQKGTPSVQKMVPALTPTPYVEPDRIFVLFESGDALSYTLEGRLLWKRQLAEDFGGFRGPLRDAGSLARTQDRLLVLVSRKERGYLLALDPDHGTTDWKVDRPVDDECTTTPLVVKAWGREVAILTGAGLLEARSTVDGKQLWERSGLDSNPSVSPVLTAHPSTGEPLVITSNAAFKIFPPGREPELLWKISSTSAAFASPLVHEGQVYFIDAIGVLTAVDLASGRELWNARLRTEHWATPVGAGDRIYCFGADGWTAVFAAAREARMLAHNFVGDIGKVTGVAVSDAGFLVRTSERLLRIPALPPSKSKYDWQVRK